MSLAYKVFYWQEENACFRYYVIILYNNIKLLEENRDNNHLFSYSGLLALSETDMKYPSLLTGINFYSPQIKFLCHV